MFSKKTEYALRAVIFIAQKGSPENKIGIKEIAQAIDSPIPFTAKILQRLSKHNQIITSVKGPGGGFYVTSDARKMPVFQVIQMMEEDNLFNKCILGLHKCTEIKPCPLHHQYKEIKARLIHIFETETIGQLATEMENGSYLINNIS